MSNTPVTQIQLRRGTVSQWNMPNALPLAIGELGYAVDTGELRIGKSINGSSSSLWAQSNLGSILT